MVLDYAVDESDADLDDYVLQRDRADAALTREVEALAAEWAAGRPVDEVLLTGNAALPGYVAERLPQRVRPPVLGSRPARERRLPGGAGGGAGVVRGGERGPDGHPHPRPPGPPGGRPPAARRRRLPLPDRSRRPPRSARSSSRLASADADAFPERLAQYRRLKLTNPDVLLAIWWQEMGRTLTRLKGRGRIDLLDGHLGRDGLDVTQLVSPRKP